MRQQIDGSRNAPRQRKLRLNLDSNMGMIHATPGYSALCAYLDHG
jgi:hypothetical protein